MSRLRFRIGSPVVVGAFVIVGWEEGKRDPLHWTEGLIEKKLERCTFPAPRNGWIVGATSRREGRILPGTEISIYEEGEQIDAQVERARLLVERSVRVWRVRFGMRGREFLALDEDVGDRE